MLKKKNEQFKNHTDINIIQTPLKDAAVKPHKQTVMEKLAELEKMDNLQFEHYMARLLALQGYEVLYTPVEDDGGADLIAKRGNDSIAVRCLLGNSVLDKDIVEATLDAMLHYSVHKVMIVTNQMFSGEAVKFARKKPIVLVDRLSLIDTYLKLKV